MQHEAKGRDGSSSNDEPSPLHVVVIDNIAPSTLDTLGSRRAREGLISRISNVKPLSSSINKTAKNLWLSVTSAEETALLTSIRPEQWHESLPPVPGTFVSARVGRKRKSSRPPQIFLFNLPAGTEKSQIHAALE